MQDVEDEPLFAERVAGIDIAKAGIEVAVRVPSDTTAGRRQQETRSFRTTRKELLALADWLRSWGVTKVGMESTGDYWKPVYFLLEQQDLDCVLYHAAQVKALPGRPKTDKQDAVWIAKITERGSLPSSFVPPEDIRRLRTHTRYRRTVTQARTAEMQRAEKLLELTARIEQLTEPYWHQIDQLDAVHGTGIITAQDVIAEIGVDMTVFPTAAHLVSWAKWCPQVARSGGKRKGSNATGRGNRYLSGALGEASMGAGRTDSFLGAKYRRLNKRMPKRKALVATGNSILTIYHALLSDPAASYRDLGPGYYDQRAGTRRQARNHLKSLERLGYKVTLEPLTPDTDPALPATG